MAGRGPIVLYGVVIHKAAASGDLAKMKEIEEQAVKWLQEHGDVAASLEVLKQEIAKLEAKG